MVGVQQVSEFTKYEARFQEVLVGPNKAAPKPRVIPGADGTHHGRGSQTAARPRSERLVGLKPAHSAADRPRNRMANGATSRSRSKARSTNPLRPRAVR
jgi:hypothetical protein